MPGATDLADVTVDVEIVLGWARPRLRDLPWRRTRDRWAVLVSEVMLQQTGVTRVEPAYQAFLERWPTAGDLAAAPLAEVLRAWSGLGYPRRARYLHQTAARIVDGHGGEVPAELDALLALPGVGPYTARAVLAFSETADVGVVDTNIGRILARWAGRPLTATQAQDLADRLVEPGRGWLWNQALMDLGATTCRPRDPDCVGCPARGWCRSADTVTADADPAASSAAVSRRQAPYRGSDRELRGWVLRRLADGSATDGEVWQGAPGSPDAARCRRIVASLVDDGLVSATGDRLGLVGDDG